MTELTETTPISFDLVPDASELEEMRGGRRELIADEDIGKSRVVVTQLAAERVQDNDDVGVAALDVTFHPDRGNRFIYAKITLTITAPESATFLDLQPRETIVESVEIAVDETGKMSLGVPKIVGGEASVGRKVSFSGQHRVLRAIGAGTHIATWEFEEDPAREEGILHQVDLALTVPSGDPLTCSLSVVAELARPGFDGRYQKFRQLIFGPRSHELTITIPQTAAKDSGFWSLLSGVFRD